MSIFDGMDQAQIDAALTQYWAENPGAFQEAAQANPLQFIQGAVDSGTAALVEAYPDAVRNTNDVFDWEYGESVGLTKPEEGHWLIGSEAMGDYRDTKQEINELVSNLGIPLEQDGQYLSLGMFTRHEDEAYGPVGTYSQTKSDPSSIGSSLNEVASNPLGSTVIGMMTAGALSPYNLGGFLEGAISSGTVSAAQGNEIADILQAAATGGAYGAGMDYFQDSLQYLGKTDEINAAIADPYSPAYGMSFEDAALKLGVPENQVAFLQNSDLGKLVGENGLLGGDYVSTAAGEAVLDTVLHNPVMDFLVESDVANVFWENPAVSELVTLGAEFVSGLDFDDPNSKVSGKIGDMAAYDWRYDERFFDFVSERSPDSPILGVWEDNPHGTGTSGSFMDAFNAAANETLPEDESPPPVYTGGTGTPGEPIPAPVEPVQTPTGMTGTGVTGPAPSDGGFLPEVTGDLTNLDLSVWEDFNKPQIPGDTTIPGGETEIPGGDTEIPGGNTEIPTGGGETKIPPPPEGPDPDDELLDDGGDGFIPGGDNEIPDGDGENEIPGGGGGGGLGGAGTGLLSLGGGVDWEDFMSGINVDFPLLQRLGMNPSEYLDKVIARLNEQDAA